MGVEINFGSNKTTKVNNINKDGINKVIIKKLSEFNKPEFLKLSKGTSYKIKYTNENKEILVRLRSMLY
jgi:hypothetical protein